ncbi:MAG TPA: hypothetical protein VK427_17220, partial [Kofleriaceae bacterium]|nr:hypothetical protein [Kofleriaceae bacterium]
MRALVLGLLVACSSSDPQPRSTVQPRAPAPVDLEDAPGLRLPEGASPLAYDLRLELDPDRTTFVGHVVIRARLHEAAKRVWLHADELEISHVTYR